MHIETARLFITRFTPHMAQSVHKNSLDDDNRRFVPDEVFETVEEARNTLEFLIHFYDNKDGPLVYPILLKNGTYIGHVQVVPMDKEQWEIGYHIGANHTRHGYATEAVSAFLPVIMQKLSLDQLNGICLKENAASIKVLERCGFIKTFEGIGSYQGEERMICKYIYRL